MWVEFRDQYLGYCKMRVSATNKEVQLAVADEQSDDQVCISLDRASVRMLEDVLTALRQNEMEG